MSESPERNEIVRQWVTKAENDLRNAEYPYDARTDYAMVTRYPGAWEVLDRSDAEEAVALAQKVKEAVRQILPA